MMFTKQHKRIRDKGSKLFINNFIKDKTPKIKRQFIKQKHTFNE